LRQQCIKTIKVPPVPLYRMETLKEFFFEQ
jgi:hypothetical protein